MPILLKEFRFSFCTNIQKKAIETNPQGIQNYKNSRHAVNFSMPAEVLKTAGRSKEKDQDLEQISQVLQCLGDMVLDGFDG